MTEPDTIPEWRPPSVPPAVRSGVYFAALIVGALATGAIGVTAALNPDSADIVAAVVGAVNGVILTIAGGLGVAYRPTR